VLSYRGFVSGARTAVTLFSTATAVGLALANDRRLTPVFVDYAPTRTPTAGMGPKAPSLPIPRGLPRVLPQVREEIARRMAIAAALGLAAILLVAVIPAVTALVSSARTPGTRPALYGPPIELRAASGAGGDYLRAYADSAPSAGELGAAVVAGAEEQHRWDVLRAMVSLAEQSQASARAGASAATTRSAAAAPMTLNGASGYAPGTVLHARITIYGCSGPGGGFCGNMSSGAPAFEGAAACSSNLPMGTKLTIAGDPTGRVYECLDRGNLASTWIDVFFNDTSAGMAWQSALGTTMADITIVN
jgi:hypothetical protein